MWDTISHFYGLMKPNEIEGELTIDVLLALSCCAAVSPSLQDSGEETPPTAADIPPSGSIVGEGERAMDEATPLSELWGFSVDGGETGAAMEALTPPPPRCAPQAAPPLAEGRAAGPGLEVGVHPPPMVDEAVVAVALEVRLDPLKLSLIELTRRLMLSIVLRNDFFSLWSRPFFFFFCIFIASLPSAAPAPEEGWGLPRSVRGEDTPPTSSEVPTDTRARSEDRCPVSVPGRRGEWRWAGSGEEPSSRTSVVVM